MTSTQPPTRKSPGMVPTTYSRRYPTTCNYYSTTPTCCLSSSINKMQVIKELRELSGAPIVDCKKAVQELLDGETGTSTTTTTKEEFMTQALDWLREHGNAKVTSKTAHREAMEGLVHVMVSDDHKFATLVKIASETDFASRSQQFNQFITETTRALLLAASTSTSTTTKHVVTEDDILDIPLPSSSSSSTTIGQYLKQVRVSIRENISIPLVIQLQVNNNPKQDKQNKEELLFGYVHGRVGHGGGGTAASVVHLSYDKNNSKTVDDIYEFGKKLAMHIVAAKPLYLDRSHVPTEWIEKERGILERQLLENENERNKPQEIIEKIINGKLQKFYEAICLQQQKHYLEDKNPVVSKLCKQNNITIEHFEAIYI